MILVYSEIHPVSPRQPWKGLCVNSFLLLFSCRGSFCLFIARDAIERRLPDHRPPPNFRAGELALAKPGVDRPDTDTSEIFRGGRYGIKLVFLH